MGNYQPNELQLCQLSAPRFPSGTFSALFLRVASFPGLSRRRWLGEAVWVDSNKERGSWALEKDSGLASSLRMVHFPRSGLGL